MSPRDAEPGRQQDPRGHSHLWWQLSKFAVLLFSKMWFRVRFEGQHHVPKEGPVLLVANHASYLDPPLVGISAGRYVKFLAQAGLAKFAPLRWWLAAVGVTLIDRSAPSKDAMRLVSERLRRGDAVGVFPEGTRSKDGAVADFRSGIEFLARRGRAAVVPVGIDGACRALPRGALFPRPRRIVVRYGAPWTAEQVLAEGGLQALRARIADLAKAPLAESRPAGKSRPAGDGPANKHSASAAERVVDDESSVGGA